jgi:hypothetical protein
MRSVPVAVRHSLWHRVTHAAQWFGAVVVPVTAGGLVGGRLGGVVTVVILVPWLGHLIGRLPARGPRKVPRIPYAGSELDALVAASRRDRHDSAA